MYSALSSTSALLLVTLYAGLLSVEMILDSYAGLSAVMTLDSYAGLSAVMTPDSYAGLSCSDLSSVAIDPVVVPCWVFLSAGGLLILDDFLFRQIYATAIKDIKIATMHTVVTVTPIIIADAVEREVGESGLAK